MRRIKENKQYKFLIPRPSKLEYKELKNDIAKHGIKQKIVLNQRNEIVDGYTRYQIAKELKLKKIPTIVKKFKTKDDEYRYLIQANIHRRHLTAFQKVKAFKDVYEKMLENQKVGRTIETAREQFQQMIGVPSTTVSKCLKVLRDGDKSDIRKVDRGTLSIDKAYRRIGYKKERRSWGETLYCKLCKGKGHLPSSEYEKRVEEVMEDLQERRLTVRRK